MISLKSTDIFLNEFGHIHFRFKNDTVIEIEEAQEFVKSIELLADNKKRCIILDTRGTLVSANSEARKYIGNNEEALKWRKADALLYDSLPVRLVGNFYMKFDSSDHPVKLFKSEEKAIKWLLSF